MSLQRQVWLYIALFMVYTQGFWERIFKLPPDTSLIVELPVWIYLLLSAKTFFRPVPGSIMVIGYVFISFLIGLINQSGLISWIKHIRFLLYFYLIFQTLWNSQITNRQWLSILRFLVFLIILQGIGSLYNIIILNSRVEGQVGLMSSIGGTTASIFPLLVISVATVIFLFVYKHERRINFYLILCVISTALVGFASLKRAVYFYVPIFVLISLIISAIHLKPKVYFNKILVIGVIILCTIPFYIHGVKNSGGISDKITDDDNIIEVVRKAVAYIEVYEHLTTEKGYTGGRTATTMRIVQKTTENIQVFFTGHGYGSVKEQKTLSSLEFVYGIVGITRDMVSGGWIIMILTILIVSTVILRNRSAYYEFTQVVRLILLLIFLATHLTYSSDFTVSLKITFSLAILCVFINSPFHNAALNELISGYFYSYNAHEFSNYR